MLFRYMYTRFRWTKFRKRKKHSERSKRTSVLQPKNEPDLLNAPDIKILISPLSRKIWILLKSLGYPSFLNQSLRQREG